MIVIGIAAPVARARDGKTMSVTEPDESNAAAPPEDSDLPQAAKTQHPVGEKQAATNTEVDSDS